MQKAYESLEWVFIEQILIGLTFPDKFIRWIMSCLKTVSYSILVNGMLSIPFDAKKDLRQGDPLSPSCLRDVITVKLMYDCVQQFSLASGLIVNKVKSSIFFGGVPEDIKIEVVSLLDFPQGALPTFWSQNFALLKKIITLVETVCKKFLWAGGKDLSKKALLSWDKVCLPKSAGGLNVTDIALWNKTSICKHYRNLCKKKR
ncbi:uncharacterized protein [Nicotiana tomentosiformis]|uniref:uncharacterized protein n=1 Tax=Nicotiana tomentosiformis TaxID=4098 RepID=UPI00388CE339